MMTTVSHSSCFILNVIPARLVVEERLDETVACPNDDTIVSASPPPQIVERGKLADSLIVEAVCDKFIEHLPIERQYTRFARAGVDIAPAQRSDAASGLRSTCSPLPRRLIEEQTRGLRGLLGTDATGIPVLDIEARPRVSAMAPSGLGPTRIGSPSSIRPRATPRASNVSSVKTSRVLSNATARVHYELSRTHRRKAPGVLGSLSGVRRYPE